MDDDAILEAMRAIRAYLPDLVGVAEVGGIDRELADLLAGASGDPAVADRGLRVLERHDATAEWVATFLDGGYPPDVQALIEQRERYSGLPGHGDPPPIARRYACPKGDFVRWRRGAAPLPPCPTHGLALAPDSADDGRPAC